MIQLSPRSFVFNGLDIIRDTLIPFIGKILRKNDKTWWNKYIYAKLNGEYEHITKNGSINDMQQQLDELLCFRIIEKNKKLFNDKIDMKLVKEVRNIRNICAHVYIQGGIIDKQYADEALNAMAELIKDINKVSENMILELKEQMEFQLFNKKRLIASRETLITYLKNKIWEPSFLLLGKINSLDKKTVENIKKGMDKTILELESMSTNEDILTWFKYHIYSKRGIEMYTKLKNIKEVNIPTFEDIRIDFLELCYGEPL